MKLWSALDLNHRRHYLRSVLLHTELFVLLAAVPAHAFILPSLPGRGPASAGLEYQTPDLKPVNLYAELFAGS